MGGLILVTFPTDPLNAQTTNSSSSVQKPAPVVPPGGNPSSVYSANPGTVNTTNGSNPSTNPAINPSSTANASTVYPGTSINPGEKTNTPKPTTTDPNVPNPHNTIPGRTPNRVSKTPDRPASGNTSGLRNNPVTGVKPTQSQPGTGGNGSTNSTTGSR